jgi:hypothetical protein
VQITSNHMGQDLKSREDEPTPPNPIEILHIIMMIWYCIVLEQNDKMLKQLELLMAKSRTHLTLQKCEVI